MARKFDIAYRLIGDTSIFSLEKLEQEIRKAQLNILVPQSLEYRREKASQYTPKCLR